MGKGYNNGNLSSLSLIYEVSKTGNTPYPQVKVFLQSKNPNSGALESGIYPEDNFFNEFEYKTSTSESKASKSALNDFVYIITEVNSKIIKGNFSGTIENDTGEIIVVSDGEFYGFEK